MADSVIQAFNEFVKEKVNLETSRVEQARISRNWLSNKIKNFQRNDSSFPLLQDNYNLNYGSFARKTKTRPLDDVDMMFGLSADGCFYDEISVDEIKIHYPDNYNGRLSNLRHTATGKEHTLSSTRVVNSFVNKLKDISQYAQADIKRMGEAATLKMASYEWNFDILPCFMTKEDYYGSAYYLIPNRSGDWRKTNPKKDQKRLSSINQACEGKVLNVIRVFKYWNQLYSQNRIPSYLLETMISDYYANEIALSRQHLVSNFVDMEIVKVLPYLIDNIYNTVNDPKGIAYDINDLEFDVQINIKIRLENVLNKAKQARQYEIEEKPLQSIRAWQSIFGDSFPSYTGQ